jgi:hypothetical protein
MRNRVLKHNSTYLYGATLLLPHAFAQLSQEDSGLTTKYLPILSCYTTI